MDEWCFFLRYLRYFQIFSPPRLFSFLIYPLLSSSSYVKFRGKLINEKFIARDDLSTKSWHHQYAIKSSLKISCKSIHTSIRILLEIIDTKMQKHFFSLKFRTKIFLRQQNAIVESENSKCSEAHPSHFNIPIDAFYSHISQHVLLSWSQAYHNGNTSLICMQPGINSNSIYFHFHISSCFTASTLQMHKKSWQFSCFEYFCECKFIVSLGSSNMPMLIAFRESIWFGWNFILRNT